MLLGLFDRQKHRTVRETAFSKFIREADSAEKKRVYSEVLKKATDRQVRIVEGTDKRVSAIPPANR